MEREERMAGGGGEGKGNGNWGHSREDGEEELVTRRG